MVWLWILIAIIVIIVLWVIVVYNGFVRLKNQVENAWSQIDVQLKRRADLIPNLVDTVKGYAKHEKSTFNEVTKARTALMKAGDAKQAAEADNMLTDALKSLFAVAEAYPDLKANQNFLQLQEELSGTENKIAASRQYYNDIVMQYNTKRETFPDSFISNAFNFGEKDLFEATEQEKKNVKVSF